MLRKDFGVQELPLIIFTLCAQMAVGIALFSFFLGPLSFPLLVTLGGLIGLGAFVSVLHLGTPLNAWRAVSHLKKSSLSREILLFGLFGASWLISLVMPGMGKLPLALTGLGLVYFMAQVYRIKAVQAWYTWRTPVSFFLSAGVLGGLVVYFVAPGPWLAIGVGLLLAAEAELMLSEKNAPHETARKARLSLILLGMAGAAGMAFLAGDAGVWLAACVFLMGLSEEIVGRWLFYEYLEYRVL